MCQKEISRKWATAAAAGAMHQIRWEEN